MGWIGVLDATVCMLDVCLECEMNRTIGEIGNKLENSWIKLENIQFNQPSLSRTGVVCAICPVMWPQ